MSIIGSPLSLQLFFGLFCFVGAYSDRLTARDWAKLNPEVEENMTVLVCGQLPFSPHSLQIFTHGLTLRLVWSCFSSSLTSILSSSVVSDEMVPLHCSRGLTCLSFFSSDAPCPCLQFEASWNPPNASYVCLNRFHNPCAIPNDDDWSLTQFRIAQESLKMCNLPERIFVYDKDNGRKLLADLIHEVD
jgi:hypothetical protein